MLAFSAVICIAVIALDQLSKAWIRASIPPGVIVHIMGRIHLTHVANTGLVFGLGQGNVLLPTLTSVLILVLIPIAIWRAHRQYGYSPSWTEAGCIALIAGGAIGNLIDRAIIHHVTDFMLVRLFDERFWPAFNVADAAIVSGTMLLILSVLHRDLHDAVHRTRPA